jgi:hypothetical protein
MGAGRQHWAWSAKNCGALTGALTCHFASAHERMSSPQPVRAWYRPDVRAALKAYFFKPICATPRHLLVLLDH